MITAVPIELRQANEFVERYHRHHKPVHRDKFRVAASIDGRIVGVCQVGRPVARGLDDGKTLEVVRLCTTGEKGVCSFLYARAARIARELGYGRIVTYILFSESGTSLKAAGWKYDGTTRGGTWDTPARHRNTTAPTCPKERWIKEL